MTTIPSEIAEALIAVSRYMAADLEGYTFVGTEHVDDKDYHSTHLVVFRDPEGNLGGFYAIRNFGAGQGQELALADEHSTEIKVEPMVAYKKTVTEYRYDHDRA